MKNILGRIAWCSGLLLLAACSNKEAEMLSKGESLYKANCKVCHAQGINGAPIVGNAKMWKPRAEQGLPVLVQHAANGFGLMPAKGGNEALTESELELAIQYMLSQLES